MLPVEGTDVHVSRCGSIHKGKKTPNFENINTGVPSALQERSKIPFPAHTAVSGWGAGRKA